MIPGQEIRFNPVVKNRSTCSNANMSTLEQLNRRWHDYFASPGAVPLLGLSPMSNEEAAEAKRAVHEFVRGRADCLPRCLEVYPAVTSTWFAVSAANGYHDGTFWPRLAKELGFPGDSCRLRPIRAARLFGIHSGSFPPSPTAKNLSKHAGFPGNGWLERGSELVALSLMGAGSNVQHFLTIRAVW